MAGLLKDEFVSEVMTELSWIMRVIDDLCEKTGLETYESTLIKYRVHRKRRMRSRNFSVAIYRRSMRCRWLRFARC